MEIIPGFYVGKAIENDGLMLVLVKEAGKLTQPINLKKSMPFSECGFCSQEELESYYNNQEVSA